MISQFYRVIAISFLIMACIVSGCSDTQESPENDNTMTITDSLGREVVIPQSPEKVVCQGAGALRYLCYLEAQSAVVGVDDIELRVDENKRPYAIANPQFQSMPLIGEFRGNTDPEKIVSLGPDVIFWTYVPSAADADELQSKTGVPVVALNYGDLGVHREDMYNTLTIMGDIMGKEQRAQELIDFFDMTIEDLNNRTADVPQSEKVSAFIGGIAYAGPHGLQSTEPKYPPFILVNALNVASSMGTLHADASKEAIIEWDPQVIFVDLSTYETTPSAVDELKEDPAYITLSAVENGEVYGVLPYNWYTANQGSVLADAYYVGKVLYPEQFEDIDPQTKADEIYTFLVGQPVYDTLVDGFGAGYGKINL